MAYVVANGSSVSILHPVRNLAGDALISGQASNLSYTITDPDGSTATTGLTWTEPNSDGWYLGAKTYGTLGTWHIEVDNSAITTSDLGKYDYYVQCLQDAAGATPSGSYLTSVANLKEVLEITGSGDDDFLLNLIARATQAIERMVGRTLVQATYTEKYDGTGTRSLNLRKGPVQSVTYVADVTYDTDGTATTTSISAGNYFVRGLADDGWHLPGWLEKDSSVWTRGQRNYEVKYVAGYSSVPYDLEHACIALCTWYKNQRKDWGNFSRDIGGGSISFRGSEELQAMMQGMLGPYMDVRTC